MNRLRKFNVGDTVTFHDFGMALSGEIKDIQEQVSGTVYCIICMGTEYWRRESQVSMI